MAVRFRNNCDFNGFTRDYNKIREFLIKLNNPNYLFGRWDWMYTHLWLDKSGLSKIGVWEDDNEIVSLATYDCELGRSYLCVNKNYRYLLKEMILYSQISFSKDNKYSALIPDSDYEFQDIAAELCYTPTKKKETDAYYPIKLEKITYEIPEGFKISSMNETYDIYKYGEVLWKGFDHEINGEGKYDPDEGKLRALNNEMKRPNVNLSLKIIVIAPNGEFVSYCGMWKDNDSKISLVEPVATVPEYRKLGLGRAAVLEGIKKCGQLGATKAFVGSSQQFYYNIGFRPFGNSTWWEQKRT